jgi:hypothetical protein
MYPLERSLVTKFQDKPFALIGVNSDTNRESVKKVHDSGDVTWRSFMDGNPGPIAAAWGIAGWPTIFIIDAKGIIRHVDPSDNELEGLIEKLIMEPR